jgi:hypothetical protein
MTGRWFDKPVLSPSAEFILNAAEGLRINSAEGLTTNGRA